MDLRQLQLFVAAADAGAFGRAAELEHISDSGLQKQVRSLETEIGLKLFEANGRNVRLTTVGRQVAEAARRVLQEANRMNSEIESIRQGTGGVVEVAARPMQMARFISHHVRSFQEENQNCRVKLHITVVDPSDPGATPYRALSRNEVNLAVLDQRSRDLDGIELGVIRLVVAMSDDDPFRHEENIMLEQLVDRNVTVMPHYIWSRQQVERLMEGAEMQLKLNVEAPSTAILSMAEAGLTWAIIGDDNVPKSVAPYPRLLDKDGNEVVTTAQLAWRWGSVLSPMEWRFVDYVQRKLERRPKQ